MKLFAAALAIVSVNAFTDTDPKCLINLGDSTLAVHHDLDGDQIVMEAHIKTGSFAGFGWGASM